MIYIFANIKKFFFYRCREIQSMLYSRFDFLSFIKTSSKSCAPDEKYCQKCHTHGHWTFECKKKMVWHLSLLIFTPRMTEGAYAQATHETFWTGHVWVGRFTKNVRFYFIHITFIHPHPSFSPKSIFSLPFYKCIIFYIWNIIFVNKAIPFFKKNYFFFFIFIYSYF